MSDHTRHASAGRSRADATHAFIPRAYSPHAPSASERVEERTLDIANRLRFVCSEMEPEELLALARRMAIVEIKYATRADAERSQG
jgi:hypothetical protein